MCALVRFTVSRWLFVLSKESEFTRSWTIETDNIDVRSTYMWKWRRFQLLNVLHIWSDESVSELRNYAFVASSVGYRYSWNLGPLKKRHEIYTVSLRKREWRRFKMKKKTITDFFQHIENLVFTPWNNSIHIRNFILDRESERGFNHSPVNNWMNKPINLFYVRQLYGQFSTRLFHFQCVYSVAICYQPLPVFFISLCGHSPYKHFLNAINPWAHRLQWSAMYIYRVRFLSIDWCSPCVAIAIFLPTSH